MKKALIALGISILAGLAALFFVLRYPETSSKKTVADVADKATESEADTETEVEVEPEPEPEPAKLELVMVGDILTHWRVLNSGKQSDGSYNYDNLFANIKNKVKEADIAIVNQETILGGRELGLSTYPLFNSPYELGEAEAEAGFNVVLSATNHSLDKRKQGLLNCIHFWKEKHPEIALLGINESKEEQEEIYVYEKDGIRVAILNYTYDTNGIPFPNGMKYCVNLLDKDKITEDVTKAKQLADFVVVCPHWGTEYQLTPDESQKKWCALFLELGVDLVIGAHPHVIEPIEMYEREDGHKMLVYYSLGNFVNGCQTKASGIWKRFVGGMADVTIGYDENGKVVILDHSVIPVICHEQKGNDFSAYFLDDYTEELEKKNQINQNDSGFSIDNCKKLVKEVWGLDY